MYFLFNILSLTMSQHTQAEKEEEYNIHTSISLSCGLIEKEGFPVEKLPQFTNNNNNNKKIINIFILQFTNI